MKNQVLSISQMRHLKEFGVDTSNASMFYVHTLEPKNRYCLLNVKPNAPITFIPTFTLYDIIELLPDYISYKGGGARLFIEKDGAGYYDDSPTSFTYAVVSSKFTFSEFDKLGQGGEDYKEPITFIDAIYRLLLFLVENGYLNNNKTE